MNVEGKHLESFLYINNHHGTDNVDQPRKVKRSKVMTLVIEHCLHESDSRTAALYNL